MAPFFGARAMGFWSDERGTNLLDSGAPYYDVYRCADGAELAVGAIEPQFFAALLDVLDLDPDDLPDQDDRARWPALRERSRPGIRQTTPRRVARRAEGRDACMAPGAHDGRGARPPAHPGPRQPSSSGTACSSRRPHRGSRHPGRARPPARRRRPAHRRGPGRTWGFTGRASRRCDGRPSPDAGAVARADGRPQAGGSNLTGVLETTGTRSTFRGRGTASMYVAYTPEQEALRQELRGYFAELMTPEVEAECAAGETGGPACLEAVRQMGARRLARDRLADGVRRAGPHRRRAVHLLRRGLAGRRADPVPHHQHRGPHDHGVRHRGAEAVSSCPRSSPASCTSPSATPSPTPAPTSRRSPPRPSSDGDEWVINGQKIFTSLASYADYIWLAARTDPDAPKHKGITIFLVPTDRPRVLLHEDQHDGERQHLQHLLRRRARAATTPSSADVNQGWDLITNQLNYERVSLGPPGHGRAGLRRGARAGPRTTKLPDGRRVIDQEWVQINLARVQAKLEFLKLINWKVAAGRRCQPRRRQRHQGVRHRVLHRGLPAADGGHRARRLPAPGLARRRARPAGSSGPSRAR